ncbi:UvrD/REP helicase [Psychromonas ingrahamii 37]|uniref:DNA 3'-5' helicase n=1 Tax=Psychromonas ingrahamii (strain DSM 17664 / CCUG 51855 / 37) TaxID=357804 RepID=A1SWI6_PSYIN|nr:UvrD-helicase domain-containing protein [Psychromonas ingrahamii]ABM03851.1 UvrD/REP helicase [Psychromonas ingrahamii 37]
MKSISSTVFGHLFGHPAAISIGPKGVILSVKKTPTKISWQALISPPTFTFGWLGQTVSFRLAGQTYVLNHLAYNCKKKHKTDCEQWWAEANKNRLFGLLTKIKKVKNRRYLRQSTFNNMQLAIAKEYNRWFPWAASSQGAAHLAKIVTVLAQYQHWQEQDITLCREAYITRQLKNYQRFFDRVEENPLTLRQRRACIIDDDNNLLLAGAGTGKTSVMIGRAGYLLNSQQAKHHDILLLAYGRKAADEMDQRIKEKLQTDNISATTFHRLGLDIIAQVEGGKPNLSVFAEDEKVKAKWVQACFETLIQKQDKYRDLVMAYFSEYYYVEKSYFEFTSLGEYYQYLTDNDIRSLKGDKVKSFGELHIANWLCNHGIEYQYEASYAFDVKTVASRQYQPDFFLPALNTYIEYYGIDENGDTAPYIDKQEYHASIAWKRKTHQKNNSKCIELTYAQHKQGRLLSSLEKSLKNENIVYKWFPDGVLLAGLKETGRMTLLAEIFAKLIGLYKAAYLDEWSEKRVIRNSTDAKKTEKAFELLKPILSAYQARLLNRNEIDFEDMIIKALAYVETGKFISPWRYIMVDEFQDISEPRARLVKALRGSNKSTSIFAVGDDWQAIYRFSGADITLTTGFEDYFGPTTQTELDQTFRFNNRIAQVATDFVSKNPAQINKMIKSFKHQDEPAVSILRKSAGGLKAQDEKIIDEIVNGAVDEVLTAITGQIDKPATVYLLARFWFQLPDKASVCHLNNQYPQLNIQTHSFHGVKGKEADYVVIMGLKSGKHSFPSNKAIPPILDALLAKEEKFEHAEERRLFYVVLTRAKQRVYIIADMSDTSCFVKELINDHDVELDEFGITVNQTFVDQIHCLVCETGTLKTRSNRFGTFVSCSYFPRCDYKERACESCQSVMSTTRHKGFKICLNQRCNNIYPLCEKCGAEMVLRKSARGEFWGCRNYSGNEQTSCRNAIAKGKIQWPEMQG